MELRNNSQRARNVLIGFYILIPIYVLMFVSDFMDYNMLQGEFSYEENTANDNRQSTVAFLFFVFYTLAGVLFIMWFRRAYFNIKELGYLPEHTNGWAAGAWFVPILNWFRPFTIMKEIWDALQNKIQNIPYESTTTLVIWWSFWMIGGLADWVTSYLVLKVITVEEYSNLAIFSMFTDVSNLIALILITLIVRKVSSWEEQAYDTNFEMKIEDHLI